MMPKSVNLILVVAFLTSAGGQAFAQPQKAERKAGKQQADRRPATQGVGAYCHTSIGRFGPGAVQPLGYPCHIDTRQTGPVYGQIGE